MKKLITCCRLLALVTTLFIACKKNDTAPPADTRFPYPALEKNACGDSIISGKDPGQFAGTFTVDMYYGTEVVAQKIDVVVIRNGNKSNVKTFKAGMTSFPTTIDISGTQLATLFDSAIVVGDSFEIGADVTTKDGQKFPAFPLSGKPYNADTSSLPGASFTVSYRTVCSFDKNDFNGYYKVVNKTWDYEAGDSIQVAPGPGNSIYITAWPNPDVGNFIRRPMLVEIDPVTNVATVPMQDVGEFAGGLSHIIDSGTGTVSPCGDSISLTLIFWVGMYYGEVKLDLAR